MATNDDDDFLEFSREGAKPARHKLSAEECAAIRAADEAHLMAQLAANAAAAKARAEIAAKNRARFEAEAQGMSLAQVESDKEQRRLRRKSVFDSLEAMEEWKDKQLKKLQKNTVTPAEKKKALTLKIKHEKAQMAGRHEQELQSAVDVSMKKLEQKREKKELERVHVQLQYDLSVETASPPVDNASRSIIEHYEANVAACKADAVARYPHFFPEFMPKGGGADETTYVFVESTPPLYAGVDFEDIDF